MRPFLTQTLQDGLPKLLKRSWERGYTMDALEDVLDVRVEDRDTLPPTQSLKAFSTCIGSRVTDSSGRTSRMFQTSGLLCLRVRNPTRVHLPEQGDDTYLVFPYTNRQTCTAIKLQASWCPQGVEPKPRFLVLYYLTCSDVWGFNLPNRGTFWSNDASQTRSQKVSNGQKAQEDNIKYHVTKT